MIVVTHFCTTVPEPEDDDIEVEVEVEELEEEQEDEVPSPTTPAKVRIFEKIPRSKSSSGTTSCKFQLKMLTL